ncbi:MAG: hypothetical protein KIT14_12610 [bacterium]|nr:hypothetical protein [bacterium]
MPTSQVAPEAAPNNALPEIIVNGRPLREVTDDALAALLAANAPPSLFCRFGHLARVRADETRRPFVERISEPVLRHRLERVAQFLRVSQRGAAVPVPPPFEVVQDLVALGRWDVPSLEAVTTVPVLRRDGTVANAPGYDPQTRLVYWPTPELIVPAIPSKPLAAEVAAARALIDDLLVDFPFVDQASRANMLALILTPILRPAISGPVPLCLLDKPKRGTGASLLAQLAEAIAIGTGTDLTTAPRDDEEWRKKITAALIEGATILFFDNVEHVLSSPSLAAALTTTEWSDRILGKSEMARALPQRATWMATGNNLRVGGDLARRSYWVRLDAQLARPWQRHGFRHADLLGHVRRHRGQLLAAVLTMARGWWAAGCPVAGTPTLGGFDDWVRIVGGVLAHAGIEGFLGNLDELYEHVDEEEVAWEALLAAWADIYGDRALTVAEVLRDLRTNPSHPFHDLLPGDLLDGRGNLDRRLGNALSKRERAVFGVLRIERHGRKARAVRWRVIAVRGEFRELSESVPAEAAPPASESGESSESVSAKGSPPRSESGESGESVSADRGAA